MCAALCIKNLPNPTNRSLNTLTIFLLIHETKSTLQTSLVGCQYHDLRGIQSVVPVQANLLNVQRITSHHLTPTKQTWPSGCWHYCKPTAPPKHAFSYLAILYIVCKATITLNIYVSKTCRRNTHPFGFLYDKLSQDVSDCLSLFSLCCCCLCDCVKLSSTGTS